MKKFLLALALLISTASFYNSVEAQNINISINIGRQPAWGPVGYDYVGFYYFPDIDIYYDVNMNLFYYSDRGRWISARYLPYAYRHYDLYGLYKVVLNVNQPWRYHHSHIRDYARYKGHRNQIVIRDSRDYRYRDSRNNRVVWYSDNKHKGNSKNYSRDNNRNKGNNYNYNSDRNKNNNRKENTYRSDNNSRANSDKNNTGRSNDRNKKYNNSQNKSDKDKNKNSNNQVNRSRTSSKSSDFRMVSNTESRKRN